MKPERLQEIQERVEIYEERMRIEENLYPSGCLHGTVAVILEVHFDPNKEKVLSKTLIRHIKNKQVPLIAQEIGISVTELEEWYYKSIKK